MKMAAAGSLLPLMEALSESNDLWAPIVEDGQVVFGRWKGESLPDNYRVTDNSPKELLLPQTESLMRFEGVYDQLDIKEEPIEGPKVAFGVRPCDAAALDLIAEVLGSDDYPDERFGQRKDSTTVVTLACDEAGEHCFCRAVGGSPASDRGSDIMIYPTDEGYLLRAVTGAGQDILRQCESALDPAEGGDVESAAADCEDIEMPLAEEISPDGVTEDWHRVFESPIWEQLAGRCRSCGICGYVCPTCYCFALFDDLRGNSGVRFRGWDSCQFEDYLLMAGDHNPRPTETERTRQRFMHKLHYFVSRWGEYGCVGCGRCADKCPVGIHMLAAIKELEEVV